MRKVNLSRVQGISFWPNDDWCYHGQEELCMLNRGLSDDYQCLYLPEDADEEEIELTVMRFNR